MTIELASMHDPVFVREYEAIIAWSTISMPAKTTMSHHKMRVFDNPVTAVKAIIPRVPLSVSRLDQYRIDNYLYLVRVRPHAKRLSCVLFA